MEVRKMLCINKVMSCSLSKKGCDMGYEYHCNMQAKLHADLPCKIKVVQIKIKTNLQFWSEESFYTGYLE